MADNTNSLPESISHGKGLTMTFLRGGKYGARMHISDAPDTDAFYVPPHWHETHDEFICVVKGRLEILLGTDKRFYGPEDGEVKIPRWTVHSLRTEKGEECVFEERTDPADDEKELFFRNIVAAGGMTANVLAVFQVFYYGDTKPVLPVHVIWLERAFVSFVGGWIAPLLGYKLQYETLKKD